MLQGIDHVVVLVPDLDAAIEDYSRLGFTVVPGGRHTVGTHNALIAFQDGAYIELIAFWEDAPEHRWHRFLRLGGGLVDYCMRTDDIAGDVAALRAAGVAMSEKQPMSRLRPDGYRVEWTLVLATETQGVTPFLIEDITPRQERVPASIVHANGVSGIAALTVAVPDMDIPRRLAPVMAGEQHTDHGLCVVNGGHVFDYLAPDGYGGIVAFLASRGGDGGVFSLSLKTQSAEASIEPARAQNARLSLIHA